MTTVFDVVTVTCFAALVLAYFLFTIVSRREPKTLLHLVVPGVVFAIANQVGNAGWAFLAIALIAAGAGYAALVILAR